jgi:tetratricopeptide (TPR) repeat protein
MAADVYCFSKKDAVTAKQFLEKALALARDSRNTTQEAKILHNIASVKWLLGDYCSARASAHEAQKLARLSANWYQESQGLRIEAKCRSDLSDYKQSIILLNRSRELLKLGGLSEGLLVWQISVNEAENHLLRSEYGQAQRIHTHILQTLSAEQSPSLYAGSLLNIAAIDVMIGGDKHDVQENLNKAKTIFNTIEQPSLALACEATLADLYLREKDTVAAKNLFQECLNSSWGHDAQVMSYCLERLADVNQWGDRGMHWSARWTVVCLVQAKITMSKLGIHKALQFLGDIFLCNGDEDTAQSLFMLALEGFTWMNVHRSQADCMLRLGDMAQRRGQVAEAVEFWRSARPLFKLSLQMQDVGQVDARLSAVDRKALSHLAE